MTTTHCEHEPVEISGSLRGYTGPVAVQPYTDEDRRAHGNIQVTDRCRRCGAERARLVNQVYEEVSPWGPSAAARDAEDQREAAAQRAAQRKADRAAYLASARRVEAVRGRGESVTVDVRHLDETDPYRTVRAYALRDLEAAAQQVDTGDGLVPIYRGILDRVHELQQARAYVVIEAIPAAEED